MCYPLTDWAFKAELTDIPNCPCCSRKLKETAEHVFYHCVRVHWFWDNSASQTVSASQRWLRRDNLDPPWTGVKRWVFFAILAIARMVIWTTRQKGLYDEISCDRKCLDRTTFDEKWVKGTSLVIRKGAMLESSFPPLLAHG